MMFLYISVIFSVVMLISIYYFQIRQTMKKKSVKGVSISMNYMKNIVTILTLVSLALSGAGWISYVAQGLSLVFGSITVVQYYVVKRKEAN